MEAITIKKSLEVSRVPFGLGKRWVGLNQEKDN